MISSVISTGDDELARGRADPRVAALGEAEALGVVGVDLDRAAVLALDQRRQVVHPRVVRAQLAAADQDHLAVDRGAELGLQAGDVGDDRRRARARSCPDGVRSTSGRRGRIGPMSIPCGFASSFASVRPSGSAPKPSPNGPTRSMKSISRSGPRRSPSAADDLGRVAALDRRAGERDLAADQRLRRRGRPTPRCRRRGPGRRRSPRGGA